jgi:hypothetical protein
LQAVLVEAVALDPTLARKDSVCTEVDKLESERRLTMVKRALLCVCVGFAAGNRSNQALLFDALPQLEAQALPPDITKYGAEPCALSQGGREGGVVARWPATVHDLAQLGIITILRKNTRLCERTPKHLATLFAVLAEQSPDPSTSPALELLFILAKPEEAPVLDFQIHVCQLLLGTGLCGEGFLRFPAAVKRCVAAASAHAQRDSAAAVSIAFTNSNTQSPKIVSVLRAVAHSMSRTEDISRAGQTTLDEERDDMAVADVLDERSSSAVLSGQALSMKESRSLVTVDRTIAPIGDPERLLLLLSYLLDGGNERCAGMLKRSAGITIDAICTALIRAIAPSAEAPPLDAPPTSSSSASELPPSKSFLASRSPWRRQEGGKHSAAEKRASAVSRARWRSLRDFVALKHTLSPTQVLALLTEEGGVCGSLFALLVELVFVLPLNSHQVFRFICSFPTFEPPSPFSRGLSQSFV